MDNISEIRISVVYDNLSLNEKLKPDWGLSILIQGLEKTILFDSGHDGDILLDNMESLGLHPDEIDTVFLSHEHKDHTGGLNKLLERKQGIDFYVPLTFSPGIKENIKQGGGRVVEVKGHEKICPAAFSTGIVSGWIPEQSLVLSAPSGLVLLTGCAHPRITNIICQTNIIFGEFPSSVIGGFHLAAFTRSELEEIIGLFKDSNITRVGPCHCTGEDAREMFQEAFQKAFIDIGVGKEIHL